MIRCSSKRCLIVDLRKVEKVINHVNEIQAAFLDLLDK
jgi:hypothetical protein